MEIEERMFYYDKYLNFYNETISLGKHRKLSFADFNKEGTIFTQIYYIYKKDYARIIDRDTKIDNILK